MGRDCFRSHSRLDQRFSDFLFSGSGPSRWGHPLEGRVCDVVLRTRSK